VPPLTAGRVIVGERKAGSPIDPQIFIEKLHRGLGNGGVGGWGGGAKQHKQQGMSKMKKTKEEEGGNVCGEEDNSTTNGKVTLLVAKWKEAVSLKRTTSKVNG